MIGRPYCIAVAKIEITPGIEKNWYYPSPAGEAHPQHWWAIFMTLLLTPATRGGRGLAISVARSTSRDA
jgi:hypothetical protein